MEGDCLNDVRAPEVGTSYRPCSGDPIMTFAKGPQPGTSLGTLCCSHFPCTLQDYLTKTLTRLKTVSRELKEELKNARDRVEEQEQEQMQEQAQKLTDKYRKLQVCASLQCMFPLTTRKLTDSGLQGVCGQLRASKGVLGQSPERSVFRSVTAAGPGPRWSQRVPSPWSQAGIPRFSKRGQGLSQEGRCWRYAWTVALLLRAQPGAVTTGKECPDSGLVSCAHPSASRPVRAGASERVPDAAPCERARPLSNL